MSLKSHFSRKPLFAKGVALERAVSAKATFLEKPIFSKNNFSRGVGACPRKATFPEKPLLEKPLFAKSEGLGLRVKG